MARNYVGFFCGTGYLKDDLKEDGILKSRGDASLKQIRASVDESTKIFAYDGCQVHGGGIFAHGVEEHAKAFINDLKKDLENLQDGEKAQVNLVAHSRGCLSAMLAIQMIQADPELKKKVSITVDMRDPVPGNFQA